MQRLRLMGNPPISPKDAAPLRFHPAAQRVREIVRSGELGKLISATAEFAVPSLMSAFVFEKHDIRFQYSLGGGCMMDVGDADGALEVARSVATPHAADPARIDRGMRATFALPGGDATAELYCDFAMPGWGPFGLLPRLPKQLVTLRMEGGTVEFYGFPLPHVYHYIKVTPHGGRARTEKVYKHPGGGNDEEWWSSYRYQLEAFVHKVRGRMPQYWTPQQDPVHQMKTIEAVYVKAGMPVRPASSLFAENIST
ncbi:hypothetical protein PHLGIDRAFT_37266 [Phlebiopsis gigantea 11061_1 CR5-6]|uniref:GFO/IDH/MocA-like oxidoreductase domain-containing protein n=1 Tax=Phlebiopsis gigantea (strain 11061_1 CR5-6) TaxID=745531 RepID=A0A0C3NG86_PHLG1|nr:hypothetical protein PHLGIDRAFT_37266 [Phlebiopsis gigantea 11061_1 CR5-6]